MIWPIDWDIVESSRKLFRALSTRGRLLFYSSLSVWDVENADVTMRRIDMIIFVFAPEI